ncbi:MAG: hypothetical protein IKJ82_01900 [Oscillospiraceae bacterium]|nr:hypothetical protein [Oscillospiraceae bacterium]MBR3952354.1 hypothetical protein [Oscillospiraceae bacterium]
MEFSSLTFLYFFLPAALILFNLTPQKLKNTALAFISAAFVFFFDRNLFFLFVGDISLLYLLSEAFIRFKEKGKAGKAVFLLSVILNCAIIFVFSLSNPFSGKFVPFGAMVISFTAIGYFVDIYKGEAKPIRNFSEFFVFMGFFGKLFRGPLIRASEVSALPCSEKFSLTETGNGLYLFIKGLAKYVVLAIPLAELNEKLSAANEAEPSVFGAWLGMIVFSMMIFFDLSGFCDMAMGLGRCFGIELPKNFYFPFQSPLVTDFLDRFNMTVTGFFRHYVYDVLRNDKNSKPQFIVNTLLICMLCGLWFGIEMNFIIWGIYIAFFIIIEEFFLGKFLLQIPRIFARIYTFAVTMFSMTVFSAKSVPGIISSFKAMFGIGTEIVTDEISFIVSQNMLILIPGAVFFISAFSMFMHSLEKKHPSLFGFFAVTETVILLSLITANLL